MLCHHDAFAEEEFFGTTLPTMISTSGWHPVLVKLPWTPMLQYNAAIQNATQGPFGLRETR
jgi:hypothetical protein